MKKFLNNRPSGKRRRFLSIIIFFLCSLVFYMAYHFKDPIGNFDLPRYYDIMDSFFNGDEPLWYVVVYMFAYGNDFIYYLFLFLFNQTPLGREFVAGLFTALYYFLLMRSFSTFKYSSRNMLFLLGLFAFPNIMYIITISRTAAAVVFFFIGVLFYFNNRKIVTILFFAVSVMTHFSSIMFVVAFFMTVLLYSTWLKNKTRTVNILCVLLPPLMLFLGIALYNYVFDSGLLSSLEDTKYDRYTGISSGAEYNNFSWLYKLQFYLSLFVAYILLIINKQSTSFSRILLLFYLSITCGLLSASQNLFNRWLILLPLLYSLQYVEIITTNKGLNTIKGRRAVTTFFVPISLLVLLVFMMMMYSSHSYFGL